MFEFLRKFSLLMMLFMVALSTHLSARNATDWRETLWIEVYPIDGDGRQATEQYLAGLRTADFTDIERFMENEAQRYEVQIKRPVKMILGKRLTEKPPPPPIGASFIGIAMWSLELRWWMHTVTRKDEGPTPDIKLFLIYFDPRETAALEHSVGLEKGRVGIVNLFASEDMAATNNFVIAHEMLHTLGATDKYGPPLLMPVYPEGYGEPDRMPLYPQTIAEIMGGRIPTSPEDAFMPAGLHQSKVGPETAREIRWLE